MTIQQRKIMHRFIHGLAKHPEKRKITQIEKRRRDCDGSKRNRGYIKEWEKAYAWLAYDGEKNAMFCSSTSSQVRVAVVRVGKIPPVRFESGEIMRSRPMKAGLVKSLAD